MLESLSLCLVTNHLQHSISDYLHFLDKVIQGGVTSVQFRDKTNSQAVVRNIAISIKQFLQPYKVPLIINDYVELAADIDADGVHIGQSDLEPVRARKLLGSEKIIGYSIETLAQLDRANQLDCLDYVAASAVFPSMTKTDCKTIWGLQGLGKIVQKSRYPVIAIGGINANNAVDVIRQGALGVAVVSTIHDHSDPFTAASHLIQQIQRGKTNV